MSNIIDISKKISNALPMVRLTDDLVVTVNNRKSTILNLQFMIKEQANKTKKSGEYDELAFMESALGILIGKKTVEEINKLDLPFPEYKTVYNAIMAAAQGRSLEEVEKENGNFQ